MANEKPENGKKKNGKKPFTVVTFMNAVEKALGRPLTDSENMRVTDDFNQNHDEYVNNIDSIDVYAADMASEIKKDSDFESGQSPEQAKTIALWDERAAALETAIAENIGKFKAMKPEIGQVKNDFILLKGKIKANLLPKTARIRADVEWERLDKNTGKKTTEHGFLNFEDYCVIVLKRTKQAVYAMLSDAPKPVFKPKETDPEKIKKAALDQGRKTMRKAFMATLEHEKDLTFHDFVQRIEAAVMAEIAEEFRKERQKLNTFAAFQEEKDKEAKDTTKQLETIRERVDKLQRAAKSHTPVAAG